MEELLAQARELGRKIGLHARTTAFKAAARAASADQEAQDVLKAYQEAATKVAELEAAGKPIEPADKRRLVEAQGKIAGNERLKAMMKAQTDYLELMSRVHQAMDEAIEADAS